MTGPRPAGRPWTPAEEALLHELILTRVKVGLIAKNLKRSPGAVYTRINSLKKQSRELRSAGSPARSLPNRLHTRKLGDTVRREWLSPSRPSFCALRWFSLGLHVWRFDRHGRW